MDNKKAIELITGYFPAIPYADIRYAAAMGADALEKQNKYRWHDLRKNPNDLPPLKKRVDVRSKLGNSYYDWLDIYNADSICWHNVSCSDEIVAWREIEPFEV